MGLVHTSSRKMGLGLGFSLASIALLAALALSVGSASALVPPPPCPSFRVLHDDRIGPAVLPAGDYTMAVAPTAGLTCSAASKLFTRFLADYDGVLPRPWSVVAQDGGEASFTQAGHAGFSVVHGPGGGEGGGNVEVGVLCRGSFTVNSSATIGPLAFPKGSYVLYIPLRWGISCNRASLLFTRFLGAPGGRLPFPWRLKNQTATFYKPEHPTRSAFRVEPA